MHSGTAPTLALVTTGIALLAVAACGAPSAPTLTNLTRASDTTVSEATPSATELSPAPARTPTPAPSSTHKVKSQQQCVSRLTIRIADNAAPSGRQFTPAVPTHICLTRGGVLVLSLGSLTDGSAWPAPEKHGNALRLKHAATNSKNRLTSTYGAAVKGSATLADEVGFAPGPSNAFTILVTVR